MAQFDLTVRINCDTIEEAEQVAAERLGYDEDYGFAYQFGEETVVPVIDRWAISEPDVLDWRLEVHNGETSLGLVEWYRNNRLDTSEDNS